jgi:hypothetical protein
MPRLPLLLALALLAPAAALPASGGPSAATASPQAVLALIDTGINPYHAAFRDGSPLAQQHPCTYIEGYPCSAIALPITLDAPDYATAYDADRALWQAVQPQTLYWIPGTKVVGAISFRAGGVSCDPQPPPLNILLANHCLPERRILDDAGHGTMTASRAAGNAHSLCPECRLVEVEGLGSASLRWAADQGWIDVTSNSWLNLVPAPVDPLLNGDRGTFGAFAHAAQRTLTYAASGNGAGYILGFAPTPTYTLSTAAPGVVLVGGHDNGRATLWSGAPPHVVADAFGGYAAGFLSITSFAPDPISCCTSAASPYAAGGGAELILEARRLLGDGRTGVRAGALAQGPANLVASGPLLDGILTLDEARMLAMRTAQPRDMLGPDDGLLGWTGEPRVPTDADLFPYGPGGNPFCQGCMATPLAWSVLPPDMGATWAQAGYGAVNPQSVALGVQALRGGAAEPVRTLEDAQYAADQLARQAELALCLC